MRGKKRPQTERAQAVGLAVVSSAADAARATGIPERTIRDWMDAPEFAELRERTKDQVAEEWWAIVQRGFRRVAVLLDSTEDVQKAATATAIVTDKMLLIRGEATTRSETRSLMDELDDHERKALRDAIDQQLAQREAEGDPSTAAVEGAGST